MTCLLIYYTICSERFIGHRMICLSCLLFASLLLTHPQIFGATSKPLETMPIFNLEVLFSNPIVIRPMESGLFQQCIDQFPIEFCSRDMFGFIFGLLAPVVGSYLVVLVDICDGVHVAVVAVWMALGSFFVAVYGKLFYSS